ncbi:hypothetical protein Q2378_27670, partial [Escherichia coli]|nr:hypothetical protein [Escherichia coli]
NELIVNWEFIQIHGKSIRIYYKKEEPLDDKQGFYFYVVEQHCLISGDDDFGNSSEVECMYNGIAYF